MPAMMRHAFLFPLLLSLLFVTCQGQTELYFSPTSTRIIPDRSTLLPTDCPADTPCQFYPPDSEPFFRFYVDQHIRLIFKSGLYRPPPDIGVFMTLSTSYGLYMTFEPLTQFSTGSTVNFGNDTHHPYVLWIEDSEISTDASIPLFNFYTRWNATLARSKVHITNPAAESFAKWNFMEEFSYFTVQDFNYLQAGSSRSLALFDINARQYMYGLSFLSSYFEANVQRIISLNAPNDIGFLEIDGVLFQSVSSQPILVDRACTNCPQYVNTKSLTMKNSRFTSLIADADRALQLNLTSVSIDNCDLGASHVSIKSGTFESTINVFRLKMGGGILQIAGFKNVKFDSNHLVGVTLSVFNSDTIYSHDDRVEVSRVNFQATDQVWVDSGLFLDSKVKLGSYEGFSLQARTVVVSYTIFENLLDLNETYVYAKVIILADSSWVGYGYKQAYLFIAQKDNLPNRVYGRATVDSLSFRDATAATESHAEFHIKGFLEEGILTNRGILAFHSNPTPDNCESVQVYGTQILPPAAPEVSVIYAVLFSANDCPAVLFGIRSYINVSEHVLQVSVEKVPGKPPVLRGQTLTVITSYAYHGGPSFGPNWLAYYPNPNQPIDDKYGIKGVLTLQNRPDDIAFMFAVNEIACPDNCHTLNGTCIGSQTCRCNPGFSGYSCYCWGLPPGVVCSEYKRNHWINDYTLNIDPATYFPFPNDTGAFINGSVNNEGTLGIQNAKYDIAEDLVNSGEIIITSTISQIRNASSENGETPGCIYVPTSRSYAGSITLNNGSLITVELDLASANTSVCPPLGGSEIENIMLTTRRDLGGAEFSELLKSRRDASAASASMLTLTKAELPSNSRSSKSKSLLDTDFSDTSNGKMLVVVKTPPTGPIETTLFSTRNSTDEGTIRLLVQVEAPEGTCTSVNVKAGAVSLFATPCETPTSPAAQVEPVSSPKGSDVKWYYYGAPIIAVVVIIIIIIIIVVTVPCASAGVNPYSGTNT